MNCWNFNRIAEIKRAMNLLILRQQYSSQERSTESIIYLLKFQHNEISSRFKKTKPKN